MGRIYIICHQPSVYKCTASIYESYIKLCAISSRVCVRAHNCRLSSACIRIPAVHLYNTRSALYIYMRLCVVEYIEPPTVIYTFIGMRMYIRVDSGDVKSSGKECVSVSVGTLAHSQQRARIALCACVYRTGKYFRRVAQPASRLIRMQADKVGCIYTIHVSASVVVIERGTFSVLKTSTAIVSCRVVDSRPLHVPGAPSAIRLAARASCYVSYGYKMEGFT